MSHIVLIWYNWLLYVKQWTPSPKIVMTRSKTKLMKNSMLKRRIPLRKTYQDLQKNRLIFIEKFVHLIINSIDASNGYFVQSLNVVRTFIGFFISHLTIVLSIRKHQLSLKWLILETKIKWNQHFKGQYMWVRIDLRYCCLSKYRSFKGTRSKKSALQRISFLR